MLTAATLYAEDNSANQNYYKLDAGVYMDAIERRLDAPAGYAAVDSSISGILRLRHGLHLGKFFIFEPSLAIALPWRSDADSGSLIFPMMLDLNLVIPFTSFFRFHLGPGIYSLLYVGTGDAVNENNGNGYSTFYAASGLSLTFNLKPQVGFELLFSNRLSLFVDAFVIDVLSSARRSYDASVSLGIRI